MSLAAWVKQEVLRLAHVPAQPQVPEGDEHSVRVFHAGRNYFTWRLILWGLSNALVALGLAGGISIAIFAKMPDLVRTIWWVVEVGAVLAFLVSLPISFFLQRLNYEMRWYIVTDRSLRIRSGVVFLQEITMTFANIQEIRVNANPLERWLGLANVEVRSAGGGDAHAHGEVSPGHVGLFAGVDNAEAIRDLLVERLRGYRDSGLGEKVVETRETPAHAAARQVLEETKALRSLLARRRGAS